MLDYVDWGMVTDIILGSAILWIVVLSVTGLCQWIHRKSFIKVDRWILWMGLIMVIMGGIYLLFNQVWVLNCSPSDPTKPSFPSSHVMVVWTIFLTTMLALRRFMTSKALRVIVIIMMILLMIAVAVGRALSGDHWVSDVIAGAIFAIILTVAYGLLIKERKHE